MARLEALPGTHCNLPPELYSRPRIGSRNDVLALHPDPRHGFFRTPSEAAPARQRKDMQRMDGRTIGGSQVSCNEPKYTSSLYRQAGRKVTRTRSCKARGLTTCLSSLLKLVENFETRGRCPLQPRILLYCQFSIEKNLR